MTDDFLARVLVGLSVLLALFAVAGELMLYLEGSGVAWVDGVVIGVFAIAVALAVLGLWPREN